MLHVKGELKMVYSICVPDAQQDGDVGLYILNTRLRVTTSRCRGSIVNKGRLFIEQKILNRIKYISLHDVTVCSL